MQKPIPYTSVLIDPASDIQLHHWAKDMQVEPHELRAAIRVVGPRLSDLRRYFGKSAHIIFLENRRRASKTPDNPYGHTLEFLQRNRAITHVLIILTAGFSPGRQCLREAVIRTAPAF